MENEHLQRNLSERLSEIENGRGGAENGILDALSALHLARIDLLEGSLDRRELDVLVQTVTNELVSALAHVRLIRDPFEVVSYHLKAGAK